MYRLFIISSMVLGGYEICCLYVCLWCISSSCSSRMRVIYHNWSATKQRPHPQSVAEISHHSVLVFHSNYRPRMHRLATVHARDNQPTKTALKLLNESGWNFAHRWRSVSDTASYILVAIAPGSRQGSLKCCCLWSAMYNGADTVPLLH